jgi:hypothetical protein
MDGPTLLETIKRHVSEMAARVRPSDHGEGDLKRAIENARAGVARIDLTSWLGREPDQAERRMIQRLIHRLAAAGKLQLIAGETGRTVAVSIPESP